MENVDAFNNELSGLYSAKPPISKAKMAAITRAAMKAIKFYKHVVQSVEKFILKCKPEYKIPGLYVIDSIVRQSRHQFGPEKDVFAPRFARNVKSTFANLFRGVPEDKSRIIRVLNLWQKNNVFAPEVINPLFDLADPNHPIYQLPPGTQDNSVSDANGINLTMSDNNMSMSEENHGIPDLSIGHQTANAKILDQSTLRQLQHIQQILIRQTTAAAQNEIANSGSNTGVSGGIIGSSSSSGGGGGCGSIAANTNQSDSVKFNKKVLEYDYDEEDEHEDKSTSPHVPNLIDGNNLTQLLKDPNVLRQLQTLQQYKKQQEEKQIKLNEMRIQEEAFEKHLQNVLKGTNCPPPGIPSNQSGQENTDKEVEFVSEDGKIEVINLDGNDSRSPTPERYNKRRRSRSRSRGRGSGNNDRDRRRRSRSRSSRSRSPKSNRRRGSSRDRGTVTKDKDREKERDREYERERKRKGLPETKKDHLSVCSTTLWVGHLSKLVQPEELSDSFGKYGDIVSIDMIHPRGCAFIVMNRRQDAYKAMGVLKNHKMQGRAITISWAAGKGVKSKEWKDFWDLELGVSYVPWSKLNDESDLEALEEGGMFDEDSMPSWIKEKINQKKNNRDKLTGQGQSSMFPPNAGLETIRSLDTTQPPPTGVGTLMPPPGLVPQFPMGPPVSRMMAGPMGPPGMSGMAPPVMTGIPPMPPNMMPPGMPPPGMIPHGMLPPPHGGMMTGFPTIPPPQIDKNMVTSQSGPGNGQPQNDGSGNSGLPPPMTGAPPPPPFMSGFNMQSMLGMPPQFQQPPPQPSGSSDSAGNQNSQNNSSNEDQMDIEMEDDMPNISSGKSSSFNQPPPLFPNFPADILSRGGENRRNDRGERDGNDNRIEIDFGGNNRNRSEMHGVGEFRNNNRSANSRWGGNDRSGRDRHNRDGNMDRDMGPPPGWHENNMGNFPGPNFNDNGIGRPGMNMPPFEIPNQQGNPFFEIRHDDFTDDRRGPNNGPPRDFFPDRYGGGGSHGSAGGGAGGPQMRGAPPQFGPRLGNIFMRGHGSRNGPHGGGGFNHNNFNDRPPFDREDRGGGGGGAGNGRNMRSGMNMQDRRGGGGRSNWRDEEDMMERGGFRRGGRFQNRDERGARDRDRSGGGGRDRNQRDRNSRDRSGSSSGRNNRRNNSLNRDEDDRPQQHHQQENVNNEEENQQEENQQQQPQPPQQQQPQDTEDDWDQELEDFNINAEISAKSDSVTLSNRRDEMNSDDQNIDKNFNNELSNNKNDENLFERRSDENTIFAQPAPTEQYQSQQNNKRDDSSGNFNNTPLYDEPNEGGGGGGGGGNGNSQNQQHGTDQSPKDQRQHLNSSTDLTDSSNIETNFETSTATEIDDAPASATVNE